MSLTKQLFILLSSLLLMVFAVNFILTINNIRSYLEGEAQIHAQDTATSLGLSLSPYMQQPEDPIIELRMNAIFDMGYYQEIKLLDSKGQELLGLTNQVSMETVPQWFIHALPMTLAVAESEISSGWQIAGRVLVTVNPGYAYLKLYEYSKESLYTAVIMLMVSWALLYILLYFTLSSLKKINQMAVQITAGQFETISPLPWTSEVKNVTLSMNMMSEKLSGVISGLNGKLETLGDKLNVDELTGLNKRVGFESDLEFVFVQDLEAFLFLIKIDGLSQLTKELGDQKVDSFILDFASVLKQFVQQDEASTVQAYRFFAGEFVLLIKNQDSVKILQLAEQLTRAFGKLGSDYHRLDIAHMGITPIQPGIETAELLFAANEAYEQARLIGANRYFLRDGPEKAKDISEWKQDVFNIIENKDYTIRYINDTRQIESDNLIMQETSTQARDSQREAIAIATFISIAEKYSIIVDMEKHITARVLLELKEQQIKHQIAINISTRTVKDSEFRAWLRQQLETHSDICSQLVFSLTAYAVSKDFSAYEGFINFVHNYGAQVIIKRFEPQSMSLDKVKQLKPDYVRMARTLSQGLANDQEKQQFVQVMQEICQLIDIELYAEVAQSEADRQCLKNIGITGISN